MVILKVSIECTDGTDVKVSFEQEKDRTGIPTIERMMEGQMATSIESLIKTILLKGQSWYEENR